MLRRLFRFLFPPPTCAVCGVEVRPHVPVCAPCTAAALVGARD